MQIENWHVIKEKNTDTQHLIYGPIEEYIDECEPEWKDDYTEISQENWDVSTMSEVIGDMLEDNNHHRMTDIPNMIEECLEKANIPTDMQQKFFQKYMEAMFARYN